MVYFLLLLTALAWSANFVIAKEALRELPPLALLFLRVLFSTLLLLALYFGLRRHRRERLTAADWRRFGWLGLFGIALNQTGFTVGIHYTSVGHSALIISLTPIFVLLLATRMKLESFTHLKVLGMSLAFAGVAVLTLEHGLNSRSPTLLGDLITLGGSLAFTVYTVTGKQVAVRYDTLTLNTFMYLAGASIVLPLTGWQLATVDWTSVSWRGWLGALYMAAVASVAAYLMFFYALRRLSASRVVVFSYLQPVLATLLAVLWLHEPVTVHLAAGGSLVLLGVYLTERGRG